MFRHVIAPARSFCQVPNEIIRHPRLSSAAVRLLTWQLSLPPSADEPLSKTATRAGLGKTAFQNAKRELVREGYLHQWREQRDGGRWVTRQLVSNVPLGPQDAAAARNEDRQLSPAVPRTSPVASGVGWTEPPEKVHPAAAVPTVGEPTSPSVGGQPQNMVEENTTHQPPDESGADGNVPDQHQLLRAAASAPLTSDHLAAAEQLLRSLAQSDPRLVLPTHTVRSWTPLAARWLERGVTTKQARSLLTEGLAGARSPLGVLRWRLEHALPERPTTCSSSPTPAPPPRVATMRECVGAHLQPRLFHPVGDERRCSDCRRTPAPALADAPNSPGYTAFRAARRCGA